MTTLALLLALSLAPQASANTTLATACTPAHDHLDTTTGRFSSDCDDTSFCAPNTTVSGAGTCQPRQCRRDEFPFGFSNTTVPIPPLCERGAFCPDEGGGCRPLVAVGMPCEAGRDEQCAPPADWAELAGWLNVNGSLCLRSVCTGWGREWGRWANRTLGQPCVRDVTVYMDSSGFGNEITKHNCRTPRFYCHDQFQVCVPTRGLGVQCGADYECHSHNCGPKGVCLQAKGTPNSVKTWQVVVTGFSVVATMIVIVTVLTLVHKRLRLMRLAEIREYYEEQMTLRTSLAALHAVAANRHAKDKRHD
ncbi:hypothetical protein GSI_12566 [Ganoderma sinense ZZ0214-1]|uniref:Transporter n=1 Tax=Ganoderma sinense ZZ0214-1 TaxID=1077348 RepID=A0A2G8RT40_9APHY|nr:hypothetical protein GSI_12566 [Ganoderma sinense ZZ0214-1]